LNEKEAMSAKNRWIASIVGLLVTVGFHNGCQQPSAEGEPTKSLVLAGVSVQTDKVRYDTGEEIAVTVSNGLEAVIVTYDQQAFCSVLTLERQAKEGWYEVRNCLSTKPNQFIAIGPGESDVIALPGDLEPGTYQLSLIFSEETFSFDRAETAVSEPFDVIAE
jgi:hypothetical protein